MENTKVSFSFGRNWQEYTDRYLTPQRIAIAREHLLQFLDLQSLEGRTFLDIGCGSGLSSLAAFDSGASGVTSFDLDPYSVEATLKVRAFRQDPSSWDVFQGSILDENMTSGLQRADIVYSWGVLHHTGQMWRAIESAGQLVKPGGLFYLGIYVTNRSSGYWLQVKKLYNRASPAEKRMWEWWYFARHTLIPTLYHRQNTLRYIRDYQSKRGMSYWTDVKDWLGGYPYEHARPEEVVRFCRQTLDMELVNLNTRELVVEYLFRTRG